MTATREQVAELYVATFNRAPLAEGLDYWTSSDFTIEMIAQCFFEQAEAQAIYTDGGEDIPSQQFVLRIFENLFNHLPQTAGLEFWVDALDSGAVSRDEMILAVMNGATGDDALILGNKTEAAIYYADQGGTDTDYPLDDIDETEESLAEALAAIDSAVAEAVDFQLTASTDDLTGTTSDDVFDAPITQNFWAGGVSNTLSTADTIDGRAGTDTLQVELVPEFYGADGDNVMEVQPDVQNVEDIQFEAMDVGTLGVDEAIEEAITVDAKDITDVVKIGSYYSDADLVIENLTTLTSSGTIRNTEEITVVMDHTDNFDSDLDAADLTVLFDEDYLVSGESTTGSSLTIRILNALNNVHGDDENQNPIEGTTSFTFYVGEELVTVDISEIAADETLDYTTAYDAVVDAINDQLEADGFTTVSAEKALIEDAVFSIPVEDYTSGDAAGDYYPILVTNTGAEELSKGEFTTEQLEYDTDQNNSMTTEAAETSDDPLSVNIELLKVGRDGEGGDLTVGGKDQGLNGNSDEDKVDGIPVFNIAVNGNEDEPSNLGTIKSTNNALDKAYISNGDDWDGASLTVRDGIGEDQELTLIDATDFDGDFSLAMSGAQQALTSKFGSGDDSYRWESEEVHGLSSGKDYSISMGSGDDTVTAALDGDSVDAIGESFALDSGSGDDVITVNSDVDAGVSQQTMYILDNMSIDSGSGDDRVTINGYERFDINTGADDDYVEITSTSINDGSTGEWNIGAETGEQPFVDRVMYNAELTVTFAGFESTVTVDTDAAGNFVADQTTINAAIIAAIDASDVLSELLDYTLGTGDQALAITSDFDGANELSIDLYQPTLVDADAGDGETVLSTSDVSAIRQGIIDTTELTSADLENAAEIIEAVNDDDGDIDNLGDGSLDETGNDMTTDQFDDQFLGADDDGTADADTEVNYSVINAGTGDGIVVLHSNDDSANTLVFDSKFGDLTVVNFFDNAELTETGDHILDFTYYLDNQKDPSDLPNGNTQSVVDIAITYTGLVNATGGTDLEANEITIISAEFDDDDTFDGLKASNLKAAINTDDTTYADIDNNTLDAVSFGEDLVGSVQDHIVLVENDENLGEYKIFYLTSEVDADGEVADGDFATVDLLGTIDFGASITDTDDPLGQTNLLGSNPVGTGWDDYYTNYVLTGEEGPDDIAPNAVDDTDIFAVLQGASEEISVADLLANDSDEDGDELTITEISGVTGGTAVLSDGIITFTADEDFTGTASFDYTLSDGTLTDTAEVSGTVIASGGENIINLEEGTSDPVNATGAADVFTFDAAVALADANGTNTQIEINDFDTAADSLQLDITTALGETTLDQLDGVDGIDIEIDPFAGDTLISFGNDAIGGELVVLTLVGITDSSLINVEAV